MKRRFQVSPQETSGKKNDSVSAKDWQAPGLEGQDARETDFTPPFFFDRFTRRPGPSLLVARLVRRAVSPPPRLTPARLGRDLLVNRNDFVRAIVTLRETVDLKKGGFGYGYS